MKVSLQTVRQLSGMELPSVDELVTKINAQLGAVEEIIELGPKYKDATIVKVISCEKHPDADKLSVCLVDDGGVRQDVPRDENGYVQVVCGAPNVRADMWAIWLPPKSTVPASFDDDEPFVLDARKLRGVLSQGMLAAGDELVINSDHDGIIEITAYDLPAGQTLKPGASFAELFGMNDTIIDIENKMFTHRPDLFGQLGVAREIAGIQHQSFTSPAWYQQSPDFPDRDDLELEVFNDAPDVVPRFMAVALTGIEVRPSPLWLQCELVRLGGKPINNIVDATNYSMLLTAQPTHAYDYDKLRGHTLGARLGRNGEQVTLLNGKTYELDESDIVIADREGAVGLAGIMGGGNSEVSTDTKRIVLEVATFDMYAVRKSAMRHGVFTDALTRFNKGQSPHQNAIVLAKLIEMIGGTQASRVHDHMTEQSATSIDVTPSFINERLGLNLASDDIRTLLKNVELGVDGDLRITPAYWRTDLELPEDIVEEVGRLYGFDRLPRALPLRSARPTAKNAYRDLAWRVREGLARAGGNEVLTYSFVHERVLMAARQDPADAYRLSNALSPDLQYYRLSLTPSLLDKVHANAKAGYDEFALFEIGKSHSKKAGLGEDGLPVEPERIALVYAAKKPREGAPYFCAKKILDFLAEQLGLELTYKPLPVSTTLTAAAPFADNRTARVIDTASGQAIGIVGEYAPSVRKAFKLPEYTAGFELFTEGLLLASKAVQSSYEPLSRYPSVERDICFEVETHVTYGDIMMHVQEGLKVDEIRGHIEPVDIYQTDEGKRRITVRVRITPYEQTMTSETANEHIDRVSRHVVQQTGALII